MDHKRHKCLDDRFEKNRCADHGAECPDQVVRWYSGPASGDHYGIPIRPDAGGGYIKIQFCPFCGARLCADDTPAEQLLRGLERLVGSISPTELFMLDRFCDEQLSRTTKDEKIPLFDGADETETALRICLFSAVAEKMGELRERGEDAVDAFDCARVAPNGGKVSAVVRLLVNGVQVRFRDVMEPMLRQFDQSVQNAAATRISDVRRDALNRLREAVDQFCDKLDYEEQE